MTTLIKIDGEKRLRRKFRRMPKEYQKVLNKELNAVGALMSKEAKASIRRSSGKYEQYGKHWSSPPGKPPNENTGDLRRSIRLERAKLGKTDMRVVANIFYAGWLEFGTKHMEARPFLRPVFRMFSPLATKRMKAAIKHLVKQTSKR